MDEEKEHPVVRAARKEARKYGHEVRPTVIRDSDEAERLERGFRILEGDDAE